MNSFSRFVFEKAQIRREMDLVMRTERVVVFCRVWLQVGNYLEQASLKLERSLRRACLKGFSMGMSDAAPGH